ncbi:MAG: right-handed parallel beta-helix repeat-containing protein [Pseudolabrys sp.]
MSAQHRNALMFFAVLFALEAGPPVSAQETEVTLNQNKAISGGVTPGDKSGFPITITRPGRYVLTSNLYPTLSKNGIEIKAYDVTIDFNGFILHGGFQGQTNGIDGNSVNTVKIMNGLIAGFKNFAIIGNDSWVVENMRVSANTGGIALKNFARVQRNTITINGTAGISCKDGCLVEGNVISANYEGIQINSGTVLGNTITHNEFFGIEAFEASAPVGFGNNTLSYNNGGSAQVHAVGLKGLKPLQPNACLPVC